MIVDDLDRVIAVGSFLNMLGGIVILQYSVRNPFPNTVSTFTHRPIPEHLTIKLNIPHHARVPLSRPNSRRVRPPPPITSIEPHTGVQVQTHIDMHVPLHPRPRRDHAGP